MEHFDDKAPWRLVKARAPHELLYWFHLTVELSRMIVYLAIYGLLFIQYALVNSIDFSQCGVSMVCFVDMSCKDKTTTMPSDLISYMHLDTLATSGTCDRAISIRALSAFHWQFAIVDKSLEPGDGVKLEWNAQELVTCNSTRVQSLFNSSIIRLTDTSDPSSRATNCSFAIESSEEMVPYLNKAFPLSLDHKLTLPNNKHDWHDNVPLDHYQYVTNKMICENSTEETLSADCPSNEECTPAPKHSTNEYNCPKNYFMRYHNGDGKWKKGDILKKKDCSFYMGNSSDVLPKVARVKCSRMRCTLCNPSLSLKQWDDPCFEFKCPHTQKMLVHGKLHPSNRLTCSAESNVTNAVYSFNSTHVHLSDIQCVKKSDCAKISPSTVFECPDDAKEECLKTTNENNTHSCPATHHLYVQSKRKDVKEGATATCNTTTGQWMVGVDVIKDSHVYCIKNKESTTASSAASENKFPYWIIFVVIGLIIVIAVAIAVYLIWRRKKKAASNGPVDGPVQTTPSALKSQTKSAKNKATSNDQVESAPSGSKSKSQKSLLQKSAAEVKEPKEKLAKDTSSKEKSANKDVPPTAAEMQPELIDPNEPEKSLRPPTADQFNFNGNLKFRKREGTEFKNIFEDDNTPGKSFHGPIEMAPEKNAVVTIGKGVEEYEKTRSSKIDDASISTGRKGTYLENLKLADVGIKIKDESALISPAKKEW